MASNKVRKRFYTTTNFTVPAGVTRLRVIAENPRFAKKLNPGSGKTAYFVDQDGKAYARGENLNGQAGSGSVTYTSTPLLMSGSQVWKKILSNNAADQCWFGIDRNGDLYACGANGGFAGNGFLGTGDVTPKSTPTLVVGGKKWRDVFMAAPSGGTFWGIDTDGNLWGWGINSNMFAPISAIGNGDNATLVYSSPTLVSGSKQWREVIDSIGGPTCAIDKDGNAWTWGSNQVGTGGEFPDYTYVGGSLGTGSSDPALKTSTPLLVAGNHKWKKIIGGAGIDVGFGIPLGNYFIGITDDGKLWGWGGAAQAVYPNGLDTGAGTGSGAQSTPVLVLGQGSRKYVDILANVDGSFGTSFIHALDDQGNIYSWGPSGRVNGLGQHGDEPWVSTPTLVVGSHKWTRMFAPKINPGLGTSILFAINDSGDLYCVGSNSGSEVMGTNDGDGAECSTPRIVIGARKWSDLVISTADWTSMYGLTRDGNVFFWGTIADGNSSGFTRSSPTLMNGAAIVLDPKQTQDVIEVSVAPGEVVPIEMNGVCTTIKGIPFARIPSQVVVEYES